MQHSISIQTYCNHSMCSTWQDGIHQASKYPVFKRQLLQQEGELLPRFAEQYQKLSSLPRRVRRSLQRKWKQPLAALALLLTLGQAPPGLAATINVSGACTLTSAIFSANTDTPSGGCTPGSGVDTIVLPANSTHTLTSVNNRRFGATGLPVIRSTITIVGNDGTIRRASTAPRFRILAVEDDGNLTLRRTTISGGVILGNGGGLHNYGGTVRLTESTISGNIARKLPNSRELPGLVDPYTYTGGDGGGVFNRVGPFVTPTVILTNSTISDNTAVGAGGGVASDDLPTDVAPDNNRLTFINSTISGNRAGSTGGGLYNAAYGKATLTNSTISGNTAVSRGGGVNHGGASYGSLTLTNTTIANNRARDFGGGLAADYNPPVLLKRTLISGNSAASGSEVYVRENPFVENPADNVVAGDFNLFGHRGLTNAAAFDRFTPDATDLTATSNGNRPTNLRRILTTSLADRGGPTQTHAVVAGSPAVDAVNDGTCPPPARDQRGVARPRDGNGDGGVACDTGSFER